MKTSVIGLGKLGLPLAAFFSSKGHEVTALDVNESLIERLRNGECPIEETGLEPLLKQQSIHFVTDFANALSSEIIFVIVPTPSLSNGHFSNEYVLNALAHLRGYEGLVVIVSTVMPGSCKKEFKPLLHNAGLCYNPEFIALGSVLHDMEYCDSILIGEEDVLSGNKLESFHRTLHNVCPTVCKMPWWSAEVAKLALNVSVTMKIGLANMLAEVCERIPGGDVDKVTDFIGSDSRIGRKYLKGGLGFGGPCFPRDGRAFVEMAKELSVNVPTVTVNDEFNRLHSEYVVQRALKLLDGRSTVSILGLTYKPNTCVVEESDALTIAKELSRICKVRTYDPQGLENAKKMLNDKVVYCTSAKECIHKSDLVVIATPWQEFAELDLKGTKVLDCWRILKNVDNVDYHALGVNE